MALKTVDYTERPDLWKRIPELFEGVWPEYNLHGDVIPGYWDRLHEIFGNYQLVLHDPDTDDVLATARGIPCQWDGSQESLGPGLDAAIVAGFAEHDAGIAPNTLCALGIEVAPRHQGRKLATTMLEALRATARAAGFGHVIVPLRPTWKDRYPLVPIDRYASWTREDGAAFDPWIRTHLRGGGVVAAAIPESSLITGTIAEWESWTGMSFPETGDYVFPHGLATVRIDREAEMGTYWEPNVWIVHESGLSR
ncbi:GNAT family N-acetyltransferase [Amycolatopsis panacis]|uniref:N-acetyltransferase n=1 Tax=Amycolatopsis panacis TaxID=2340917 RepID=A0A419HJB9_9PSEU|nr:GNAT family N-acetyltransferase [Amycolatopsis panacis]RJQ75892.1 N-acetyltransferase [Amycolatopsis panacis]